MSTKSWNFAPTCCKILLLCRTSWLPTFEISCAVLSLQQQLAPQTSCSCQNKAGANSCCPREGKRHSRRDGQAKCYSKCLQCSSVVVQLQENQISWLPSLCFLSTLSLAFTPSAGSGLDAVWGSVPQIIFSNCCPINPMPNWSLPLSGQLRLWLGECGMSSKTCLGPALTVRHNRN